jgi:hypothetical protein
MEKVQQNNSRKYATYLNSRQKKHIRRNTHYTRTLNTTDVHSIQDGTQVLSKELKLVAETAISNLDIVERVVAKHYKDKPGN